MKIAFTLLAITIPFLSFSQKDNSLNYFINTGVFGSFTHNQKFKNPTGEKIPIAVGSGYKVGGSVIIPRGMVSYSGGLNFRQIFSLFEVSEVIGGTSSVITDLVRQSYLELPIGISFRLNSRSSFSIGGILQAQIESGRKRKTYLLPNDISLLEPLDRDLVPGNFGAFLKFEKQFSINKKDFVWDILFQTNHDEIELPNTLSTSSYQLYFGGGLSYFLTTRNKG